jgi:hypothetical protein
MDAEKMSRVTSRRFSAEGTLVVGAAIASDMVYLPLLLLICCTLILDKSLFDD